MSCDRTNGTWEQGRLVFDNVVDGVFDDHLLDLDRTSTGGGVTGRFLHPTTLEPLADALMEGTCRADGIRPRITFTRRHADGRTTTLYTGKVIFSAGPPAKVFIRGRFTRTTVGAEARVTMVSGDWETEKPT